MDPTEKLCRKIRGKHVGGRLGEGLLNQPVRSSSHSASLKSLLRPLGGSGKGRRPHHILLFRDYPEVLGITLVLCLQLSSLI